MLLVSAFAEECPSCSADQQVGNLSMLGKKFAGASENYIKSQNNMNKTSFRASFWTYTAKKEDVKPVSLNVAMLEHFTVESISKYDKYWVFRLAIKMAVFKRLKNGLSFAPNNNSNEAVK